MVLMRCRGLARGSSEFRLMQFSSFFAAGATVPVVDISTCTVHFGSQQTTAVVRAPAPREYATISNPRGNTENTALLKTGQGSGGSVNSPPLYYADPLGRRQGAVAAVAAAAAPAAVDGGRPRAPSTAEELEKYFDLKKNGAITQEEFDAFKAKLMSE